MCHPSHLKTDTAVTALSDAWCHSLCQNWLAPCPSTVTGSESEFKIHLLSLCGSMQTCLNRSTPELHFEFCWDIMHQETNQLHALITGQD